MTALDTAELRRKAEAAKARGSWHWREDESRVRITGMPPNDTPSPDEQLALLDALEAARAEIERLYQPLTDVEIAELRGWFDATGIDSRPQRILDRLVATIAQLRAERDELQMLLRSNAALTILKAERDEARKEFAAAQGQADENYKRWWEAQSQIATARESGLRRAAEIVESYSPNFPDGAGDWGRIEACEWLHDAILTEIGEKK